MTCVLLPDVVSDLAVDRQSVINEQFFAALDGSNCMDEYAITRLDCFAVGRTRMVQEAGAVAATTAVDHASVGKSEYECVSDLG